MVSIKKSLGYSFILSFSQVLIPLISIPYISRILDPTGVGKVGFIDSFTYYFVTIAEFGIVVYGMREVARTKNDKHALQQLVSELVVLHLITSAVTIVLYGITVFFLWSRINDTRLLFFSFSFLLINSFACEWYFLGMERFRYITSRSLATRLLGLASIFILIKAPADYYIYYGIMVTAACLNSIWNITTLAKALPLKLKGINWKKHAAFTRITYGISLLYSVTLMLDNVFLRLFSTVTAVGFYSFAIKIVRISSGLLSDSLLVFFPRIVMLIKDEKTDQLQEAVLNSIRLLIFLAVPLCMGLFLLSGELVHFYLGNSFARVIEDLKILAIFPLLKIFSLFTSKQILISHNHEKLYLKNLFSGSLVFCVAMPLLSFYFADQGACYAIVITELVILCLNYYSAKRIVGTLRIFDFIALAQAILATLFFIPIVLLLRQFALSSFLVLLSSFVLCLISYILIQVFAVRNVLALHFKTVVTRYLFNKKGY